MREEEQRAAQKLEGVETKDWVSGGPARCRRTNTVQVKAAGGG